MNELKQIECCACGIIVHMTEAYYKKRLEGKETWYCLNGHPQSFIKSTSQVLRDKLDRELAERLKDAGKIKTLEEENFKLLRKLHKHEKANRKN